MSVPQMNRKLVLEAPERVPDAAGGYRETWVARGEIWGAVAVRGSGRDVDRASRLQLKITIRATPPGSAARPGPQMRFREGARLYDIEAVHEADVMGRTLICFATEEVGR